MTRSLMVRLAIAVLSTVAATNATTIDFEAQGASAPSAFNGTLNSPLVIGIATFTGGKLLKNEAASVDATAVYATVGGVAGYTDPLVITFSQAVNNVSLMVTNETPDTYTLADNLGNSFGLTASANSNQTLSLTDSGVTQITIATTATVGWDFAIDNVSFTSSAVPEPSTVGFFSLGLMAALLIAFKIRKPGIIIYGEATSRCNTAAATGSCKAT